MSGRRPKSSKKQKNSQSACITDLQRLLGKRETLSQQLHRSQTCRLTQTCRRCFCSNRHLIGRSAGLQSLETEEKQKRSRGGGIFFPKTQLPPAGAVSFLSLHSVRNMASHRRDSSQMAVAKPHRWSYLHHGSRPPQHRHHTDGSVHLPCFKLGWGAPLTDQRGAESNAKAANRRLMG